MRKLACSLLLLLVAGAVAAPDGGPAPPRPPAPAIPARVADENAALQVADADAQSLPVEERLFVRYVLVDGSKDFEDVQAVALTANYVSRASVIIRPVPIVKAGLTLVRLDLRKLAPKAADLKEFAATWEELRFDPRFNLLITKDTLKFATGKVPLKTRTITRTKKVRVGGKGPRGKWVTKSFSESVEVSPFEDGEDVVRAVSDHIDKATLARLIDATGSQAPVVTYKYFIVRALSTIKDKGVFKTIYGGLYYEFTGIGTGFKKGTDEDNLLEQLGMANIASGVTAAKIFEKTRSDQRVAVFRSDITGMPRIVEVFNTAVGRDMQHLYVRTRDVKRQNIDIAKHAMMNLLNLKEDASEVIFEGANGTHRFVLFNAEGKRQDVVPPDIAADHLVPSPYHTELQPAIGCIRCHGVANHGGWRLLKNDVTKLAKELDIFGEKKRKKNDLADTIDRLVGLYSGNLELKLLPRGRDDYANAVLQATGPLKSANKGQTDIVKAASAKISALWGARQYVMVDANMALTELGFAAPKKGSEDVLRVLLPPVVADDEGEGFIPEDPRLGALMAGLSISRTDWDLTYSFAATRVQETLRRRKAHRGTIPKKADRRGSRTVVSRQVGRWCLSGRPATARNPRLHGDRPSPGVSAILCYHDPRPASVPGPRRLGHHGKRRRPLLSVQARSF